MILDFWGFSLVFQPWLLLSFCLVYTLMLKRPAWLLIVFNSLFLVLLNEEWKTVMKLLLLGPCGLGLVVVYVHYLDNTVWIQRFVTGIVLCNVLMMAFTPSDDTWRGFCGKLSTILLSLWLYLQRSKIEIQKPFFVYTGVSKEWILCHAIYRSVLMTLPYFETQRYFLNEVYSLGLTYFLAKAAKRDWNLLFGMADSLIMPTVSYYSCLFDRVSLDRATPFVLTPMVDVMLAIVQIMVSGYCILHLLPRVSRHF
ncbi:hypothetical protein EDD86DRAFT_72424 [Gorgonomyces haynaldii]|nr:hypothetical protein EDD86DRAFT_72424 [Gorgonomyces haynaldii]